MVVLKLLLELAYQQTDLVSTGYPGWWRTQGGLPWVIAFRPFWGWGTPYYFGIGQ